jgi:ketosteroid isomerase-like protein
MSVGNAEVVARLRSVYDAFNRGDFDGAIEIAHPDVKFFPPGGQLPLEGTEQLRAWMEPSAFETQVLEPLEFTVSGSKVMVLQRVTMRGAGSGIEMEVHSWNVWTLDDDGRVTRIETYLHHEEAQARQAAGLAARG